jgi:uncharacterized glyoxalase superfamily protein PhnB
MECSCCGEDRTTLAALPSRGEVQLCRDCLESLLGQVGVSSTPTLPVVDLSQAINFYERAGFGVRVYEENADASGEGFAFVDFDGQSVFDLDVVPIDPERNGAGCYLIVNQADEWHERMSAAGLPVSAIADRPWGMREFTLTDPSGNHIRIGRGAA